jgi:hypothetical protein
MIRKFYDRGMSVGRWSNTCIEKLRGAGGGKKVECWRRGVYVCMFFGGVRGRW